MSECRIGSNSSNSKSASGSTCNWCNNSGYLLNIYRQRGAQRPPGIGQLDPYPQYRRDRDSRFRDHVHGYRPACRHSYIYSNQLERMYFNCISSCCNQYTTRCPDRPCDGHGYSADLCRNYGQCRDQRVTLYR